MSARTGDPGPRAEQQLVELFESASGQVFVVCPGRELLVATVAAAESTTPPPLSVLTMRGAASDAGQQFPVATRLADLVEAGTVDLRVVSDETGLSDAVCLTPDRAVAVLTDLVPEGGGIGTDDPDRVGALRERFRALWQGAETYEVGTPAYSRLLESMDHELVDGMGDDFAAALAASSETRGVGEFDVVDLLLLLGAKHECQFYRVSRWGEEMGVGSTSKFSKAKRRLENTGFIETDAVKRDSPGRPRERLRLAERVGDLDATELETALQAVHV